jgi:hypothetical protein
VVTTKKIAQKTAKRHYFGTANPHRSPTSALYPSHDPFRQQNVEGVKKQA